MVEDIRWQQRFQNFDRAFSLINSALDGRNLEQLSDLEQEGLIQRFEYTYELAWKTMKDYLEDNGINLSPVTPRNVIKEAFAAGVIGNGQTWIDMMLHRNMLAHTYDFSRFTDVLTAIEEKYLNAFRELHKWLNDKRITP
jgi:nucleotidyltransferase substrate binding protein (TIGR01987 family)